MKRITPVIASFAVLALPAVAAAATGGGDFSGISNWIKAFIEFINKTLVPLVFAIAFLVFIWGAVKYFIIGGNDEGKREEGRNLMLYSVIAFVLMISIWGIVNMFSGIFGDADLNTTDLPKAPEVN